MSVNLTDHEIKEDYHEASLEDIIRKAKSFENEDDDLETTDETIEAIMAKARAFEAGDEIESLTCILDKVKTIDRNPCR